jgi:hypothetical protein
MNRPPGMTGVRNYTMMLCIFQALIQWSAGINCVFSTRTKRKSNASEVGHTEPKMSSTFCLKAVITEIQKLAAFSLNSKRKSIKAVDATIAVLNSWRNSQAPIPNTIFGKVF